MPQLRLFEVRISGSRRSSGRLLFARIAIAGCLFATAFVHAQDVVFDIGGTSIRVPVEPGYVSVSENAPELHRFGQAALPPSNRLVDSFYTPEQLAAMQGGESVQGHYFMIQSMRSLEPLLFSVADWEKMQPEIISGIVGADVQDGMRKDEAARDTRMREETGRDVALRFGELKAPEIYARTPESIRFLMNIPAVLEIEGETHEIAAGAAGAVVLVQNKILFVYWYAVPASSETVDEARRKLDSTVETMVAMNASDASVASSPSLGRGMDWGRVGLMGVVGGGLALLASLIAVLVFRRK